MCPVDGWATVPCEAKESVQLTAGTVLLGQFTIDAFIENDGAVANYRAHDKAKKAVRIALIAVPEAAAALVPGALASTTPEGERMLRAAQALGRLQNNGIAKVIASGLSDEGELAIVSEQVAGQSLEEVLRAGPISGERAMELGLALFSALEAVNLIGIAHHDLAPARVHLLADGRVVVSEMGYADLIRGSDSLDENPTMARGAAYRAPEQARGRAVTHHADIYSVGAILFEVLTGKVFGSAAVATGSLLMPITTTVPVAVSSPLPFAVDKKQEGAAVTREVRIEAGSLPGAGNGLNLLRTSTIETPLAELVGRCLEKKPWNRYDTATIAREALEAARDAVEAAGPIGRAKLGEFAWDAPQPESATRESARPDTNLSGLLSIVTPGPTTEKEAPRPRAAVPDIELVAPIARATSSYARPRPRRSWWPLAAAGVLVAGGIGLALESSDDSDERVRPEVAAVDTEQWGRESREAAARQAAVEAARAAADAEAVALQKAEHEAKITSELRARAEREAQFAAALKADAEAQAAAEAKAKAEAPMVLEAVGPEDGDAQPLSAETKAAAEAKVVAQAKIDAQIAAKAQREADAKAKADAIVAAKAQREADAKAKADAIVAAKREADAKLAAKAPVVAEAPGKKTWAQIRDEEIAANLEIARVRTETATKARLEREAKEAEAARTAEAARVVREAAWKKKVEDNERAQKALEEQRKADIEARRQARLDADAEKKAAAEKLAKAAKVAKSEKQVAEDPSLYRALLATVPAGASVLVDGGLIGKTPITLTWKPGSVKHVWVMLEGHTPTGFDVGDAQHTKMLRLELVPVAAEKLPQVDAPEDP